MDFSMDISITAKLDQNLAPAGQNSVRHLLVEVEAPKLQLSEGQERKPVNLALVIDSSGSMQGLRLESAKMAARGIIEEMKPQDILSLVSFSTHSLILARHQKMDGPGKQELLQLVAGITATATTNLSDGWLDGAQCVAEYMGQQGEEGHTPGHIHRVLLLSDGHANAGIVDPAELADIARNLKERGIISSTVGIGDGYSTAQLQAIAESGGGILHDAEHPDEIVEVVMGELEDLLITTAENVDVQVGLPVGVTSSVLAEYDSRVEAETFICALGSLTAGRSRKAVLRLRIQGTLQGEAMPLSVGVRWNRPGEKERRELVTPPLEIRLAPDEEVHRQPRDLGIGLQVAIAWQSFLVAKALHLNAEHRRDEAQELIRRELDEFETYCREIPAAQGFVHELRQMARMVRDHMGDRLRKNMSHDIYRSQKGVADHRRKDLASWKQLLVPAADPSIGNPLTPRLRTSGAGNGGVIECPLRLEDQHPIIVVNGLRLLVDSGVPISIGSFNLEIAGQQYSVDADFMGMSIHNIRQFVNTPLDGLLGMDILGQHYLDMDLRGGVMRMSRSPLPLRPNSNIKQLQFIVNVPVMEVHVGGQGRIMFFDTGAKISYIDQAISARGIPKGVMDDFYPGFGQFRTQTYELPVELIPGESIACCFGVLPSLLQSTLSMAKVDGIIGTSVLEKYALTVAFPERSLAISSTV